MDPVKRAEAELEALMGKTAQPAAIAEPAPGEGNPGEGTAPNPDKPAEPQTPATPQTPTESPKSEDADYWRQRFEVMQGKYNAEIPRLVDQVNALNTKVQELTAQGQAQETPANKPASVEEALSTLHDTYGSDLTDALDRLVQARLQGVEEKVNKVETVTAKSAWEKFYDHLDKNAENWRKLNSDPGFLKFLESPAPFVGIPYSALLTQAFEAGNAERTAEIFNHYSKSNPTAPDKGGQVPDPSALAAPPKRGGGDPSVAAPAGKRVFTMDEVNAFYKDLELGRYRGKEKDADALEKEILIANKEGRIVG